MKSSCISHPESERLVIIRKWQVEFCEGNQCAAAVMSFLEYWHNWKLESEHYNHRSNQISEAHGDGHPYAEDIYQFHSINEISEGILGLYGHKSITEALRLLEQMSVISTHRNPNPRYVYDKTKYFRFYPEICQKWLKNYYKSRDGKNAVSNTKKCDLDPAVMPDAFGKNTVPNGKNAVYIETEINNKDNNHSINAGDLSSNPESNSTEPTDVNSALVQPVINVLREQGMPAKHFTYADVPPAIQRLCLAGATVPDFIAAFERATQYADRGFGVKYLVPIVESILTSKNSSPRTPAVHTNHSSSLARDVGVVYGENIVDPLIQTLMDEEDKRIDQ